MEAFMKLVKCIVRTHKADETTDALRQIDVSGVVVSQVKGRGRQTNPSVSYRCIEYRPRYRAQMMIDVVVPDHLVDEVVRVVMTTAGTGESGDGRVFVIPVEEAYSIRSCAWRPD
ncbi:MAG: P-II family nitrogen regulator [Acidobacteria bacterium]|nr:MAG: P-II family nitrogen regulator [Acidobacteriota bacterium]